MISIGLVASPTFLLLSGAICGHLATSSPESDENYRWRLIDRGSFLLLFAHLALGLVPSTWETLSRAIGESFYITDAVGVGLIVAAFVDACCIMVR
jgi:hypothetical protein